MTHVLHIARYPLAGMPYRIAHGADLMQTLLGITADVCVQCDNGLGFPAEPWERRGELAAQADVLHVHHIKTWRENRSWLMQQEKPIVVTIHGCPDINRQYTRAMCEAPPVQALTTINPVLRKFWPDAKYIPNFILSGDLPDPIPWEMKDEVLLVPPLSDGKTPEKLSDVIQRSGIRVREVPRPRRPNKDLLQEINRCRYVYDNLNDNPGVLAWEAAALGCIPIVGPSVETVHEMNEFFGPLAPFPTTFLPPFDDVGKTLGYLLARPNIAAIEQQSWSLWAREANFELPIRAYASIYRRITK